MRFSRLIYIFLKITHFFFTSSSPALIGKEYPRSRGWNSVTGTSDGDIGRLFRSAGHHKRRGDLPGTGVQHYPIRTSGKGETVYTDIFGTAGDTTTRAAGSPVKIND